MSKCRWLQLRLFAAFCNIYIYTYCFDIIVCASPNEWNHYCDKKTNFDNENQLNTAGTFAAVCNLLQLLQTYFDVTPKTQQRSALSALREHRHHGGSEHLFLVFFSFYKLYLTKTEKVSLFALRICKLSNCDR